MVNGEIRMRVSTYIRNSQRSTHRDRRMDAFLQSRTLEPEFGLSRSGRCLSRVTAPRRRCNVTYTVQFFTALSIERAVKWIHAQYIRASVFCLTKVSHLSQRSSSIRSLCSCSCSLSSIDHNPKLSPDSVSVFTLSTQLL